MQDKNREFYKGLEEYHFINTDSRLDEIRIYYPDDDKIIVQGLEIARVNVMDRPLVEAAYKDAVEEAENLAAYISNKFEQFKNWKYLKAADGLYIREKRHFSGLYLLSVNDVLGNRYFDDTVAMGSSPIQTGKFAEKGIYLAGKPVQYGIPLGCLIPVVTDNMLMVGAKASYSSLAASSAGTPGTAAAGGEAAGVAAVYCLARQIKPSDIIQDKSLEMINDIRSCLEARGFYMPKEKIADRNASDWSYPAVRQLLTLGLIAGGQDNNFCFVTPAKQKDLAIILLNGIYRLDRGSYSLDLDARIRPYFIDEPLTREKAAEILAALHGLTEGGSDAYKLVCGEGYMNDVMQLRLKNKNVLTMDDVYYLGAYNIKLYTGKDIKD